MTPRWLKVGRDLWLHAPRTALVVLAIAVGLAGAGTVLNAWALVEVATTRGYLASQPASATLRMDSVDAELLSRVRAFPGVQLAQARRTVGARVRAGGAWQSAVLYAMEDFESLRIGVVTREVGAWPPPDGAIVIERSSLDYSGAAVGESLQVVIPGMPLSAAPVAGVARDVGLAPGWMEHVVYAFVTARTLARWGAPSTPNELQIVVRPAGLDQEAVRRIAYAVKGIAEQAGHRVSDVSVPVPGEHIHAAQMDSLLMTQGAFGVLALILSAFLVVNLMAAMLAGQVREIGIMKAIGARNTQLTLMYLGTALVLGLAATMIALPVAVVAGRSYAHLKADLLNFPLAGYAIPWWVLALQVAVGLLLPVSAAAIPVARGCGMTVGEALRDVGMPSWSGDEESWLVRAMPWMSRPLALSLRNAFRKRQRLILTLLALSGGGAVYLGARNLRASVIASVDALFAPQHFDMVLRLADAPAVARVEEIVRGVSGVAAADAWVAMQATRQLADGALGNRFGITAMPAQSSLFAPSMSSGRWLSPADTDAIVINGSLLKFEPGLTVGGSVPLVVGGQTRTWRIVGVLESGPQPVAYALRDPLTRFPASGTVNVVARAGVAGDAAQVDLIMRLRAALGTAGLPVASSTLLTESKSVMQDHLLMVTDFLAAMAWLMIVVGGLGLASAMGMAVLERTREIGVLKAIGAKHRSIFELIQVEGLVIAVLSWAVALPLSIPMSVILAKAFGRIMIPVPVTYLPEGTGVIAWLGLVIVVALLACAWPAIRALRMTTASALAYE
ncbi:MAG: FtsX-like permease family protein [Gemmatimonadaceae bacterium]